MPITQAEVQAVDASQFGAWLFNLYTKTSPGRMGHKGLIFSSRMQVVRAMIRAMLEEEAKIND